MAWPNRGDESFYPTFFPMHFKYRLVSQVVSLHGQTLEVHHHWSQNRIRPRESREPEQLFGSGPETSHIVWVIFCASTFKLIGDATSALRRLCFILLIGGTGHLF